MEWQIEEVFKLINLYKQFPCIWDYKSCEYKRIDKKRNAWEEIAKNMGKTEETIKKKIKHLRSAYHVEKKKVENSKKSGSSVDDTYTPHLFYYDEMRFLEPVVSLRQTSSNYAAGTEQPELIEFSPIIDSSEVPRFDDSQDSIMSVEGDTPMSYKVNCGRKRKIEREQKFNCALDAIIKKTTESSGKETMFSHFGKSVGMQLEDMDNFTAIKTMAEIQNILSANKAKKALIKSAMNDANIL